MDKIRQYQLIVEIKPGYHGLIHPYFKPSKRKVILNIRELELYYSHELGIYFPGKTGGNDSPKELIITCLDSTL
jgi:hypothetical protein